MVVVYEVSEQLMLHGEDPEEASGDRASAGLGTITAVQLDSDGGMLFLSPGLLC